MSPAARRTMWRVLTVVSMAAWAACRLAKAHGWISHEQMDEITNDLSWLALVFSVATLAATTNVRVHQEPDGD